MCNKLYKGPVYLPCHKTICQSHIDDLKKENKSNIFKCFYCKSEHEIPDKGFPENDMALGFLRSNSFIYEQEKHVQVEFDKSAVEFTDLLKEFEKEHQLIHQFVSDHFSKLRSKIDLQRDHIKAQIDKIGDQMKKESIECENLYKEKLLAIKKDEILSKDKIAKIINNGMDDDMKKAKLNDLSNNMNKLRYKKFELINLKSKIESCTIETRNVNLRKDAFGDLKLINNYELINGLSLIFSNSSTKGDKSSRSSLYLNEYKFLSCGDDYSIKMWNSKTGSCLTTLNEHRGPVNALQLLSNDELVSASSDHTIKIWNLAIGFCVNTLFGHDGPVICLTLSSTEKIISGSTDSTIKIWNIKDGTCVKTLNGHKGAVYSLKLFYGSGKLLSGSEDKTIKIWGLISGSCINTIRLAFRVYIFVFVLD